jgi:hypothetical protein
VTKVILTIVAIMILGVWTVLGERSSVTTQRGPTYTFKWIRLGMSIGEFKDSLKKQMDTDKSIGLLTFDIYGQNFLTPDSIDMNTVLVDIYTLLAYKMYVDTAKSVKSGLDDLLIQVSISSERVSGLKLVYTTDSTQYMYDCLRVLTNGIIDQMGAPVESRLAQESPLSIDSGKLVAYGSPSAHVVTVSKWNAQIGDDELSIVTEYQYVMDMQHEFSVYWVWSDAQLLNSERDSVEQARVDLLVKAKRGKE